MADQLRCPECNGPIYGDVTIRLLGLTLGPDGAYNLNERDAERRDEKALAYCGDCETEWPSIDAILENIPR